MAIRDRKPAEINVVAPVSAALPTPRQVARDAQPGAGREGATTVPIEGVSARLLARMNESLGVPTATSFREIDVATLEAERSRLNATLAPRKLSYTHLLAFAVAQAVAVHPEMAAFYREIDGRPHRVEPARVGLGLAVDVEQRDGSRFLVVPVIAGADDLSFPEFVAAYDALVERARTGRLAADDLAGGMITLTNPGLRVAVATALTVPVVGLIIGESLARRLGPSRPALLIVGPG